MNEKFVKRQTDGIFRRLQKETHSQQKLFKVETQNYHSTTFKEKRKECTKSKKLKLYPIRKSNNK